MARDGPGARRTCDDSSTATDVEARLIAGWLTHELGHELSGAFGFSWNCASCLYGAHCASWLHVTVHDTGRRTVAIGRAHAFVHTGSSVFADVLLTKAVILPDSARIVQSAARHREGSRYKTRLKGRCLARNAVVLRASDSDVEALCEAELRRRDFVSGGGGWHDAHGLDASTKRVWAVSGARLRISRPTGDAVRVLIA